MGAISGQAGRAWGGHFARHRLHIPMMSAGECSGDTFAAFTQARSARRRRDRDAWARRNTICGTARSWISLIVPAPACALRRDHGLAHEARGGAAQWDRGRPRALRSA
jgi:hypothetical protein